MIEEHMLFDLMPGVDMEAYTEWAKKTIGAVLRAPGIVEFRASRNIMGSPEARATGVWESLADWANFVESDEWQALWEEGRVLITNVKVELWGPSPVVPEPLRPNR